MAGGWHVPAMVVKQHVKPVFMHASAQDINLTGVIRENGGREAVLNLTTGASGYD